MFLLLACASSLWILEVIFKPIFLWEEIPRFHGESFSPYIFPVEPGSQDFQKKRRLAVVIDKMFIQKGWIDLKKCVNFDETPGSFLTSRWFPRCFWRDSICILPHWGLIELNHINQIIHGSGIFIHGSGIIIHGTPKHLLKKAFLKSQNIPHKSFGGFCYTISFELSRTYIYPGN